MAEGKETGLECEEREATTAGGMSGRKPQRQTTQFEGEKSSTLSRRLLCLPYQNPR